MEIAEVFEVVREVFFPFIEGAAAYDDFGRVILYGNSIRLDQGLKAVQKHLSFLFAAVLALT